MRLGLFLEGVNKEGCQCIRIKSLELGFPGFCVTGRLGESFASPKAQLEGLLRLHQA